jgi:23S rRNA (uracil1939-C5)-methyltransferase
MLSRGDIVELDVESAAYKGVSVARRNGLVILVRNGVPGDRVRARVVKKKRQHAEAVVEEVLKLSPSRVAPACRYFGTCGGCSCQNVDYRSQLSFKQAQVAETLQHLGGITGVEVKSTLPSPNVFYYRNKMEFTFGPNRWLMPEEIRSGAPLRKGFALGLHIPKRHDKILDLEVCFLQSPVSVQVVNRVRRLAEEQGWQAYSTYSGEGYLRNLVIRIGSNTGDFMVNLVTRRQRPDRMKLVCAELLREFPQITTIVNSINETLSPVASGQEEVVYHGAGVIRERIGDLEFRIAPTTFFQPNTSQARNLFEIVRQYAGLTGHEIVYDLYCGVGTIALFLARRCQKVVGIDNHETALAAARANAVANGIRNCTFVLLDAAKALNRNLVLRQGRPEVLIVDPPRAGMHKRTCWSILDLAPERVVYVSCNPATQARDLKILSQRYRVESVRPVDMFPQTYHIENVASLVRT